jgi:signal transduction histidine kinase/FixJ family two-component response regulator
VRPMSTQASRQEGGAVVNKRDMWLLIVDDDEAVLDALRTDLKGPLGPSVYIETCLSASEALNVLQSKLHAQAPGAEPPLIPVIITDFVMPGQSGIEFLREVRQLPLTHPTFNILLTGQANYESVRTGINEGLIHRALGKPWTSEELYHAVKDLFSEFLLKHCFDQIEHHTTLVSHSRYSKALLQAEERQRKLSTTLHRMHQGLLAPQQATLDDLVVAFRAAVEALQSEQSFAFMLHQLKPGEQLFQEGEHLGSMWLVLSGTAAHYKSSAGSKILFQEGLGHILGAMAFFTGEGAFTTVRAAEGPLEVACLRPDVLERLFAHDPALAPLFVNILLRQGMTRVKQQIEQELKLTNTLEQLRATETQLLEAERLATLGQLVAGIAHELNNPTAALTRSSEHVHTSVTHILAEQRKGTPAGADVSLLLHAFHRGHDATPLSTRTIRETADTLAQAWGIDLHTSRSLAEMGYSLTDKVNDKAKAHGVSLADYSQNLSHYFQTGKFLRNIETSSMRVAEIVSSLKNYVRPVSQTLEPVDINRGLEDTILLLHSRIKLIELSKDYGARSNVMGIAGELNQVWTNLLTNALDAVAEQTSPAIHIKTADEPTDNSVTIVIADNGCGIAPEKIEQIFELNYTTKKQGHFGLGLGLAICKNIILKHGGTIVAESTPGEMTRFVIKIPLASIRRSQ